MPENELPSWDFPAGIRVKKYSRRGFKYTCLFCKWMPEMSPITDEGDNLMFLKCHRCGAVFKIERVH